MKRKPKKPRQDRALNVRIRESDAGAVAKMLGFGSRAEWLRYLTNQATKK